ncbi:MAG: amidohydrolase family protein [Desulfovibrio sp.]|jgi:predicted TIM-barrel fold metal-dependent hydrolase|nr:amidohydrolase family protein [Desulfovibrio sp.]
MLFDIHTHAFHPKIAAKAVAHLNKAYGISCIGDGTIESLLAREDRLGLDGCVILCAATTPSQVVPANDHAISLLTSHPRVIPFGTLHPEYPDWEKELSRLAAAGIRGIKFHPDFQGFRLDDPRLLPIFEHCQGRFLFQIHVGADAPPERSPSCPAKMAAILDAFPDLTMIVGHMGGYRHWTLAMEVLPSDRYPNLWYDTSSVSPFVDAPLLRQVLGAFDRERMVFGTDWPLFDPVEEVERLQSMGGLSMGEIEGFMENAAALLGEWYAMPTSGNRG